MILIVDHFDSFSHNLYQLLAQHDKEVEVLRADSMSPEALLAKKPRAIVLSPGPGRPEDTGITLPLLHHPQSARLPVVGVCLGFQALSIFWGAKVELAPEVVHGKTLSLTHRPHEIFKDLPQPLKVGRYHSLCVPENSFPETVQVLATHQGMVMAAIDKTRPWVGFQFHPESFLTPQGDQLLQNTLNYLYSLGL